MARREKNEAFIALAKSLSVKIPWCDDYEKMISGMPCVHHSLRQSIPSNYFRDRLTNPVYLNRYNSFAPELVEGRLRGRKLVKKYNDYLPDDATDESLAADREMMLKAFIGHVGKDVCIDPPFRVDYGCNTIIGDGFYANFNMVILDCAIVTIGDRVKFGPNVSVFAATHPIEVQERRESPDYSKEVTIGNDCWIGGHSVIMPGVTIGDGVTIGANSVVTRDIPSFSVAVGSPARVIRKLKPVDDVQAIVT